MGKCDDENVITERNRMCLASALKVLHILRDVSTDEYITEALDVVFEYIDEAVILLNKFGNRDGGAHT